MLEQLKYQNHMNEIFEFGKDGIFVDSNDLHDYMWNVETKGQKISAFRRAVQTRKLPVVIICETEQEGIQAKNKLHEVAEKDVLSMQPGRIIIGQYYFECYITASAKTDYLINKKYLHMDLTLTSDMPFWVTESVQSFAVDSSPSEDSHGYPFDFPFDYPSATAATDLTNASFTASNFRIIIYGEAVNPSITIAGHTYQVNCTVNAGEFLTIDSVSKKIYVTSGTGAITNVFNLRNKDSYIFEKIPSGQNSVAWDSTFNFDVILIEERSEPKWI